VRRGISYRLLLYGMLNKFCFTLIPKLVLLIVALALSLAAYAQVILNLVPGWNLLGNSSSAPIDVTQTFGDSSKFTSVWKWDKATNHWMFYAPSMSGAALSTFAQQRDYEVLSDIAPKEGYWVYALAGASLVSLVSNGATLLESDLQQGWNLVGSADSKAPMQLNQALANGLNGAGKKIVSAWGWDAPTEKWKFYSPALDSQGGAVLADYISSKAYLPFGAPLSATEGFWLNIGVAVSTTTTVTSTTTTTQSGTLQMSLPNHSIGASELAVIVAEGDVLSESIANYYQQARGIPAANIIRVKLATAADTISASDFALLKDELDAKLPGSVQAMLLTWTSPSRVVGSCVMSITSALALGFDAKYCGSGCAATAATSYFDSESSQPWQDHKIRPSMMLGTRSLEAAIALIDRGVSADASQPGGDGYLLRTSDRDRSVRYGDQSSLPALWSGNNGLQLNYIDNSAGGASDSITGKSNVLFYFTGLARVPNIASNGFRPGAIADHLTSTAGYLPSGNGQMTVTDWLDAGVTASYGTVAEPCNYTKKFSRASVLIDQYYRGASLIEAYWKSVEWPGQGLFVGEPLAKPFSDQPGFTVSNGQYLISTRAMRPNKLYVLEYRTATSSSWKTLASFTISRAQPQSLRAPLPPATATQLRWVGPCPANANQQCTLSTSG
jgi:uncharacterized protein (TIGR03790 family)